MIKSPKIGLFSNAGLRGKVEKNDTGNKLHSRTGSRGNNLLRYKNSVMSTSTMNSSRLMSKTIKSVQKHTITG